MVLNFMSISNSLGYKTRRELLLNRGNTMEKSYDHEEKFQIVLATQQSGKIR